MRPCLKNQPKTRPFQLGIHRSSFQVHASEGVKLRHPDLLKATYPKPVTLASLVHSGPRPPYPHPFYTALLSRDETSEGAGINHSLEQGDHWGLRPFLS